MNPDDIVGVAEIAARLKVAPDTIHQWRRRHETFPQPYSKLDMGSVWIWADVEAWALETDRL